jgi:hypothetical protein
VDKLVAPLRRIKLNDPVHVGDIDTSCCQISCQQHGAPLIIDLVELYGPEGSIDLRTLFLFNFSMQFCHLVAYFQLLKDGFQCLMVEVNRCTGAEEDNKALRFQGVQESHKRAELIAL